jgi:hypothetical protein
VLTAFREVEDGLVGVQSLRDEADAAGRAAEAARLAVGLATLRYEGGVDSYLNLLDAQREQLTAELLESQLVRLQRVSVVSLQGAGGGWDPVTDTPRCRSRTPRRFSSSRSRSSNSGSSVSGTAGQRTADKAGQRDSGTAGRNVVRAEW